MNFVFIGIIISNIKTTIISPSHSSRWLLLSSPRYIPPPHPPFCCDSICSYFRFLFFFFLQFWRESKFLDTSFNFFNTSNLVAIVAGVLFLINTIALSYTESLLGIDAGSNVMVFVGNILGWIWSLAEIASVVVGCYGFFFHLLAAIADGGALDAFKGCGMSRHGVNTLSTWTWVIHVLGMVAPMAVNFILPNIASDSGIVDVIGYVLTAWSFVPYILALICFILAIMVARKQDFDVVTPDGDGGDISSD